MENPTTPPARRRDADHVTDIYLAPHEEDRVTVHVIRDGLGNTAAWVPDEDDARFIARACNSHEKLLRACRLLKRAYDNGERRGHMDWSDVDLAFEAARAGLAFAEA